MVGDGADGPAAAPVAGPRTLIEALTGDRIRDNRNTFARVREISVELRPD